MEWTLTNITGGTPSRMGHPGIFLFSQPHLPRSDVRPISPSCLIQNWTVSILILQCVVFSPGMYFPQLVDWFTISDCVCKIYFFAEPTCEKSGRATCHWERENEYVRTEFWIHLCCFQICVFKRQVFCAILLAMACPLRCIAVALLGEMLLLSRDFWRSVFDIACDLGCYGFFQEFLTVSFFEPIFSKTIHQQTTTVWQKVILGPQVNLWTRK